MAQPWNMPSFESYGNYSSSNYGVNSLVFTDQRGRDYYFSYKTLVGFRSASTGLIVRQNDWSTTTGKHLNWIDGGRKADRLTEEEFTAKLVEALA